MKKWMIRKLYPYARYVINWWMHDEPFRVIPLIYECMDFARSQLSLRDIEALELAWKQVKNDKKI